MRRFPAVAAAALVLPLALTVTPAQALVPADVSLVAASTSSVVSVSPDVYYDASTSTYYLYTTGMRIGVYSSADGEAWSEVPGAVTPTGPYFDPSVVKMPDGTYRMYYVYRAGMGPQPCSGKQLKYATSTDLIRWTAQSPVLLDDLGCGVPNVVYTGTEYRLYYVRGGVGIEHGTYMATSPDGLTWTPTDKLLTPKDFVDPSVVRLTDGSWLMFTADFSPTQPPPPGFVQRLYVGTSQDGITWDFDADAPVYTAPTGQGAFDPDAVMLPDGSVRAWWAQGSSADNAQVTAGRVTVTPSPGPDPDPVPVAPSKPTVKVGKAGIAVTWTYAAGASAPDGFIVQVKAGSTWKEVARTERTSSSVTWAKVGAKKGMSFGVRVVAVIADASATSSTTRATRPR
ncbi:MAG: hypothetical protein RLZ94_575 [Actinomycetota bacterium]